MILDVKHDTAQVQLTGAVSGRYVIREQRPGGELVLAPDTSIEAIRERAGTRAMTDSEWAEFMRVHGPQMLPPDGEG